MPLFTPSHEAKVDLSDFAIVFKESGIKLYDQGISSSITLGKFEQVKAIINLQKAQITG